VSQPEWLSPAVILAIHDEMLSVHGGLDGLRDSGTLESALSRPRNLFEYGTADIFELAAAYISGVVRNHPFADGNKRTGFVAGYVFLAINGQELNAAEHDVVVTIFALAAGELSDRELALWLEQNCSPVS
jgi:death-on-curing protein